MPAAIERLNIKIQSQITELEKEDNEEKADKLQNKLEGMQEKLFIKKQLEEKQDQRRFSTSDSKDIQKREIKFLEKIPKVRKSLKGKQKFEHYEQFFGIMEKQRKEMNNDNDVKVMDIDKEYQKFKEEQQAKKLEVQKQKEVKEVEEEK